jgi:hypothetical protein
MKLLLASPCQIVIQDKEAGGHSLIGIFHHFKIRVPETADIPANALLPREWAIFSKWSFEPSETEKKIKLVAEAFWPNDEPLFRAELVAAEISDNQSAFIIRNGGFPMGQNGLIKIILSIFVDDELAHDPVVLSVRMELVKDLPE